MGRQILCAADGRDADTSARFTTWQRNSPEVEEMVAVTSGAFGVALSVVLGDGRMVWLVWRATGVTMMTFVVTGASSVAGVTDVNHDSALEELWQLGFARFLSVLRNWPQEGVEGYNFAREKGWSQRGSTGTFASSENSVMRVRSGYRFGRRRSEGPHVGGLREKNKEKGKAGVRLLWASACWACYCGWLARVSQRRLETGLPGSLGRLGYNRFFFYCFLLLIMI
jgi:hypothetical protein